MRPTSHDKEHKDNKVALALAGYVVGHGDNILVDCLLGQDNALKEKNGVMV